MDDQELLEYITPDGKLVKETTDQIIDRMRADRKLGYRTTFTCLETGRSYEVSDSVRALVGEQVTK